MGPHRPIGRTDTEVESFERRRWDLNPRLVAQHTISSRADSAALALLRDCSLVRLTARTGTNGAMRVLPLARDSPSVSPKGHFEFMERSPNGNLGPNWVGRR